MPAAVHTAVPELQSIVFFWQEPAAVQSVPGVQAMQVPLSQTSLEPQVVPLATLLPVSAQDDVPDAHEVAPVWQTFVGVQEVPAVHVVQAPLSQTFPVPQVAPFVVLLPVSSHTGAPVVHDVEPVWHALVGVQTAPGVQALQDPLSQT